MTSMKTQPEDTKDSDENTNKMLNRHASLLTSTKASVKRVMEEAATKKLLYYDNITVNVMCASIEACLLDGLQRRVLGIFEENPLIGLLKKVARQCDVAAQTLDRMRHFLDSSGSNSSLTNGIQSGAGVRFFSDSTESLGGVGSGASNGNSYHSPQQTKSPGSTSLTSPFGWFNKQRSTPQIKHLWLKLALIDKKLMDIIEFIVSKNTSFYDENSIMTSSLSSRLFLDLIAGPCSLDFSMVKPSDHLWTEPDASELIDRHRIHSHQSYSWHRQLAGTKPQAATGAATMTRLTNSAESVLAVKIGGSPGVGGSIAGSGSKRRPNLKMHYYSTTTSPSLRLQDSITSVNPIQNAMFTPKSFGGPSGSNTPASSGTPNNVVAKEYVESLHQNMKHVLLYGKNNVIVQPKEEYGNMQGYLSLHQNNDKLHLKWTPNQLMNHPRHQSGPSSTDPMPELDNSTTTDVLGSSLNNAVLTELASQTNRVVQWDSALSINMENIVYLHCHQRENQGGKLSLVCQDGVQHPPFYFPPGGHLLQFLNCLETGLNPQARLDPPLMQINDAEKTFPKLLPRRSSAESTHSDEIGGGGGKIDRPVQRPQTGSSALGGIWSSFNRSIRRQLPTGASSPTTRRISSIGAGECADDSECDFVFRIVHGTPHNNSLESCSTDPSESAGASSKTSGHFNWESQSVRTMEDSSTAVADTSAGDCTGDSINTLCSVMKKQILSRAFYGWLQYYRNLKTVRTKFNNLVLPGSLQYDEPCDATQGLTDDIWKKYLETNNLDVAEIHRLIYFGGCSPQIRKEVWPRLLGHYPWWGADSAGRTVPEIDKATELAYERNLSQWRALEVIIIQRQNEQSSNYDTCSNPTSSRMQLPPATSARQALVQHMELVVAADTMLLPPVMTTAEETTASDPHNEDANAGLSTVQFSEASVPRESTINISNCDLTPSRDFYSSDTSEATQDSKDKHSGSGTNEDDFIYSDEQITLMSDNLHRIDKDVDRCDRNYAYFSSHGSNHNRGKVNLKKLRNIMVSWVWQNISIGYVQGMCDLLAPLLVVLDCESLTFVCFSQLMQHMIHNFPQTGTQMDNTLSMMRLLLQITDSRLYDHVCSDGELTSLYVTYRWFLLDFKRELQYSDVFCVWETIWSSREVASKHFNLFLALSMLQYYRDIILDNDMEYTDIIKFFNEMAEKHQVQRLLYIARELIESIRDLLQPK